MALTDTAPDAAPPEAPAAEKPKSLLKIAAAMTLLTLVAAAMGGGVGFRLADQVEEMVRAEEKADAAPIKVAYAGPAHLAALAPIVTNLAAPADTWIRIEGSLVFEDESDTSDEVLSARIAEDILAFLQTVSLQQIETPSGMQHLREDLAERARIRSEGRVRELVVHTLVVQ